MTATSTVPTIDWMPRILTIVPEKSLLDTLIVAAEIATTEFRAHYPRHPQIEWFAAKHPLTKKHVLQMDLGGEVYAQMQVSKLKTGQLRVLWLGTGHPKVKLANSVDALLTEMAKINLPDLY